MRFGNLYHGKMRIGLLGGSFNPAHGGHRHICLKALARFNLTQVWWLVSPHNPLKALSSLADYETRLAAARATARHPRMRVTDLERTLRTRYTVDTIRALKRRFPRVQFFWLMGADNLGTLHRWRHWRQLARLVPFIILDRGVYMHKAVRSRAGAALKDRRVRTHDFSPFPKTPAWCYLPIRKHPASSTQIRKMLEKSRVSR